MIKVQNIGFNRPYPNAKGNMVILLNSIFIDEPGKYVWIFNTLGNIYPITQATQNNGKSREKRLTKNSLIPLLTDVMVTTYPLITKNTHRAKWPYRKTLFNTRFSGTI